MLFFCVCDRFFSSPFPEEISLQYIYRYADDILLYLSKCGKPIPWGLLSLQSHSSISPWLLEWLYVQSKTTDIVRKETSTLNRKSIMAEMVVEWHYPSPYPKKPIVCFITALSTGKRMNRFCTVESHFQWIILVLLQTDFY